MISLFPIFSFFLSPFDACLRVPGASWFGSGRPGGGTASAATRPTPPVAPAPLAVKKPAQSVTALIGESRKMRPRRNPTILTNFASPDGSRRTTLGAPLVG